MACTSCKTEDVDGYSCDSCHRLFCGKCANLSSTEIRCLQLKVRKLLFLCDDCNKGLTQVPILIEKVDRLTDEIKRIKDEGEYLVNKSSENVVGTQSIEQVMLEIQDRQNRAKNVIISNIKESSQHNNVDRKKDDKKMVKEVINKIIPDNDFEIRVQRLGKFEKGKNRLIKVLLSDNETALTILRNKAVLDIPSVKIFADQTINQRIYFKSLIKEVEKLRAEGDDSKIIKYVNNIPKIVNKDTNKFQNKRQKN